MANPEHNLKPFDVLKTIYFSGLALKGRRFLEIHQKEGLWIKDAAGASWRNVSEHCLVEAARVTALAEQLGLPQASVDNLFGAALLHDYQKRREREVVKSGRANWENYANVYNTASEELSQANFPEDTIHLARACGHDSLLETQEILAKIELSEDDIAFLVMHYADDYTVQSAWAKPAEADSDGGLVNDLDRRMDNNEKDFLYRQLNEDGRQFFNGETTFQAQRRIGSLVEQRLASLLQQRSDQAVEPKRLPELIDQRIKEKIEQA